MANNAKMIKSKGKFAIGMFLIILVKLVYSQESRTEGLLYPRESETREVLSLDGMWNFAKSNPINSTEGLLEKWFEDDLEESVNVERIPVPSSFNDLDTDVLTRDHIGSVWYERKFFVPIYWQSLRVVLRFGSVHYEANVWINGGHVTQHSFGHLPFEVDISENLNFGNENRITVLCNNTLTLSTIPQGQISQSTGDNGMINIQQYSFDFFNYAGIHRSVHLYTTPKTYIRDVNIDTTVDEDGHGHVNFEITSNDNSVAKSVNVNIYDKDLSLVASQFVNGGMRGVAIINNVRKWWPYLMDSDPGYLYTIELRLSTESKEDIDIYRMKFGVRTLKWTNTQFLINDRPIYFRGMGLHEDSDFRGRGLDFAILTRDFALMRWIGANVYRTTHYPHSEESMQFADEYGIMIIDECGMVQTNVDTQSYTDELLRNHKSNMEQLIHRDRSHPSVVMWSISNEPKSEQTGTDDYFNDLVTYTKQLDSSRPVTASITTNVEQDQLAKYLDVLSFNRFNGWNTNTGRLDMIINNVVNEARQWHERHLKPVILSEYGAETLQGLHLSPAFVFSEEYQMSILSKHFEAFDKLRGLGFFIGEFVHNFSDFNAAQSIYRVGASKKGIFTRNRQPKTAAHLVRKRYFDLAAEIDDFSDRPLRLYPYISRSRRPQPRKGL
ncbi:Beta-glucuronidase [Pseudolycoriella hygida]|uniref:Beta-glucuronidase n=1 Tax=Pseudolycoriella hygida TaxID=35572 RepID=A0A9Q0MJG1_9DIPT|nr:Beta-glucuronidase [Pseudolycoriella hygida]